MHFTHQGNPHNDKTIERLMAYSDTLIEMIDLFNNEFTTICPEDADDPQVYANLVGVAGEDDENIENYELGKLVGKEMDCPLSDVVVAILEAEFAVQRLGRKLQDEVAEYCKGDDPEWDAEWKHINSFYSDSTNDCETPDFVTSKVTGEVFCTLEGYARLSRLPPEIVFKRVYVLGGRKRFNMQEILIEVYDCDDEVNIIPLTEVAKWIVGDNLSVAKLLIGSDGVILPANFISQIRNQKALDIKPQAKLIPQTKLISVRSQPISDNKSVEGTVYLIGNRENNTLKIGFSNGNVRTRLAAFQVSCAHRLEILKTKKGTLKQEKELLERFKKFKIRNEWFTWDDSIIENF